MRIFSRFGPLIGDRNSSAGLVFLASWYFSSSATRAGALLGTLQVLMAKGPAGMPVLFWMSHPFDELMNATNFLAAVSLSPVVDLGMYAPFATQTVACG